jgi:hypothetical protein
MPWFGTKDSRDEEQGLNAVRRRTLGAMAQLLVHASLLVG